MWLLSHSLVVSPSVIPYEEPSDLILIQNNSLVAICGPVAMFTNQNNSLDEDNIKFFIKEKYSEMDDLLICMIEDESTYCQDMRGDSGLTYGCYQIHIDKHDITEECAMDFKCSLEWTARKIKEGKGYLWTTYEPCLTKLLVKRSEQ